MVVVKVGMFFVVVVVLDRKLVGEVERPILSCPRGPKRVEAFQKLY